MQFIENKLKTALKEGRKQIGCWLMTGSPLAAEICASSGFDWVLIDMEHTPNVFLKFYRSSMPHLHILLQSR